MGKKREFINKCDYENLNKIVENDKAVGRQNNGLKVTLYSLFICLINKYKKADFSELFVVNGKERARYKGYNNTSVLYYALTSNSIFEYHKMLTHVSYIRYYVRFKLIISALRYRIKEIPFGYFLDYILWKEFFSVYKASEIGGFGHYDRLTTQIALLSDQFGKKYYIRQHGLIGHNMELPYKIPVNRVVAFDEDEVKKFKNEVVLNPNCDYQIEYVSSVDFEYTEKNGKRIGIIDTPIDEMTELISLVERHFLNEDCIVMLHPLSKIKEEDFNGKGIRFISGKKKELNFDAIFAGPSTLVYDYVRAGFINPIIVYELEKKKELYDMSISHKNITMCYSKDEFDKMCEQIACSMKL